MATPKADRHAHGPGARCCGRAGSGRELAARRHRRRHRPRRRDDPRYAQRRRRRPRTHRRRPRPAGRSPRTRKGQEQEQVHRALLAHHSRPSIAETRCWAGLNSTLELTVIIILNKNTSNIINQGVDKLKC
jgi:hypothetical protein